MMMGSRWLDYPFYSKCLGPAPPMFPFPPSLSPSAALHPGSPIRLDTNQGSDKVCIYAVEISIYTSGIVQGQQGRAPHTYLEDHGSSPSWNNSGGDSVFWGEGVGFRKGVRYSFWDTFSRSGRSRKCQEHVGCRSRKKSMRPVSS